MLAIIPRFNRRRQVSVTEKAGVDWTGDCHTNAWLRVGIDGHGLLLCAADAPKSRQNAGLAICGTDLTL
jgi:hypothetical protein